VLAQIQERYGVPMEDTFKSAIYTVQELGNLKRPDLNRIARKLKIKEVTGKNEDLISRIVQRSMSVRCTWDEDGELVAPEEFVNASTGVRTHPVLGEWKYYIVEAREQDVIDETFANNHFSARIKMGEKIAMPKGFADFISNSCYTMEHYYDEQKIDPETGTVGYHTSRRLPDFFVREVE
jgi:hypothetical protein